MDLGDFPKHPSGKDGHLNQCRSCRNSYTRDWLKRKKEDRAEYVRYLREQRKKSRLKSGQTYNKKRSLDAIDKYNKKYPEKLRARLISTSIPSVVGYEKHHWSYKEGSECEVVFLKMKDHRRIHRYLEYDQSKMKYRNKLDGILLETWVDHIKFINRVIESYD